MLKFISGVQKNAAITGFRNVRAKDANELIAKIENLRAKIERNRDVAVQVFDAGFVASWQHLYFAALNASIAFRNGKNLSRSLAMEALLYASAQHQIRKATEMLGIKLHSKDIALLIIGTSLGSVHATMLEVLEDVGASADDSLLEITDEKAIKIRRMFGIQESEMKSVAERDPKRVLVNLVIERMALLATEH